MAKHTVFLSYDGMTDPLGQSQVIPYLEGLVEAGNRISLISFEKPKVYAQRQDVIAKRLVHSNIRWLPQTYTKKPPILSTVKDIRTMTRVVVALHREDPIQLLHARSYIAAFAARTMHRRFGLPWIFDMRGFYADERVDGGLWPQANLVYKLVYRYFKQQERSFLADSAAVVSLTSAGKQILAGNEFNVPADKIYVIPCCADLERFDFAAISRDTAQQQRESWHLNPDQLVVMYLGSVGTWYMLPEMMQWFKGLLTQHPSAVLVFVTGEPESMVLDAARTAGVPAEQIRIGRAPYEDVPAHLSMADLGIFFIKPVFSKQASSPTKMGEMMGMGLPLVCNSGVGDVDAILEDTAAGIAIDAARAASWETSYARIDELLAFNKNHIREGAVKYYSLTGGIKSYQKIYQTLLADGAA